MSKFKLNLTSQLLLLKDLDSHLEKEVKLSLPVLSLKFYLKIIKLISEKLRKHPRKKISLSNRPKQKPKLPRQIKKEKIRNQHKPNNNQLKTLASLSLKTQENHSNQHKKLKVHLSQHLQSQQLGKLHLPHHLRQERLLHLHPLKLKLHHPHLRRNDRNEYLKNLVIYLSIDYYHSFIK